LDNTSQPFLETGKGCFRLGERLEVKIENNKFRNIVYKGKLVFIDTDLGQIILFNKSDARKHTSIKLFNIVDISKLPPLPTLKDLRNGAEKEVADIITYLYKKEHRMYNKRSYAKHKLSIIAKHKQKYRNNVNGFRDKIRLYQKKRNKIPVIKAKLLAYGKKYYAEHKLEIAEKYQANKDKDNERRNAYVKEYMKRPGVRIKRNAYAKKYYAEHKKKGIKK